MAVERLHDALDMRRRGSDDAAELRATVSLATSLITSTSRSTRPWPASNLRRSDGRPLGRPSTPIGWRSSPSCHERCSSTKTTSSSITVADRALPAAERLDELALVADLLITRGTALGSLGRYHEGAGCRTRRDPPGRRAGSDLDLASGTDQPVGESSMSDPAASIRDRTRGAGYRDEVRATRTCPDAAGRTPRPTRSKSASGTGPSSGGSPKLERAVGRAWRGSWSAGTWRRSGPTEARMSADEVAALVEWARRSGDFEPRRHRSTA